MKVEKQHEMSQRNDELEFGEPEEQERVPIKKKKQKKIKKQ